MYSTGWKKNTKEKNKDKSTVISRDKHEQIMKRDSVGVHEAGIRGALEVDRKVEVIADKEGGLVTDEKNSNNANDGFIDVIQSDDSDKKVICSYSSQVVTTVSDTATEIDKEMKLFFKPFNDMLFDIIGETYDSWSNIST